MFLKQLTLRNFRNYRHLEIELTPGILMFNGTNAQGKSNLLEAIYILALTKSPRADSDRELIRFDSLETDPYTRIAGTVRRNNGIDCAIQVDIGLLPSGTNFGKTEICSSLQKRIRINGVPRRASETLGTINAVLFSSEDISIILGPPSARRKFLDVLISQLDRGYLQELQRYQKIVAARNHLLRKIGSGYGKLDELIYWDQQFCASATKIIRDRIKTISELIPLVVNSYSKIASNEEILALDYLSAIRTDDLPQNFELELQTKIHEVRRKELLLGQTTLGPHRDDLKISLNGLDLAKFGSRGQSRTMAIALRLAEANLLTTRLSEEPILLLDDAFSEMDRLRQQKILSTISNSDQVLLTTVDVGPHSNFAGNPTKKYRIAEGNIFEETG